MHMSTERNSETSTRDARGENALTLATILGIAEDVAAQLLDKTVLITMGENSPVAFACADFLQTLLARTITAVLRTPPPSKNVDLEILVCTSSRRTSSPYLSISIEHNKATISDALHEFAGDAEVHKLLLFIVACYSAAAVMNKVIGNGLHYVKYPVEIVFGELLEVDNDLWNQEIDLGECHLAGAGAIGNALLYSLQFLKVKGTIHIADHDTVSAGNLNRCLFFSTEDIGKGKSSALASNAQRCLPSITLLAYSSSLQDLRPTFTSLHGKRWLKRLLVGVDSRRARRHLQSEVPCEVYDASTTDISEVILTHNHILSGNACLSCIYFHNETEARHERHLAETLGVTLKDVNELKISEIAAKNIQLRYPTLNANDIIGMAYDTLFKQLCGQQELRAAELQQVAAPFAFVSALSGALLAINLVKNINGTQAASSSNYYAISPWASTKFIRRKQYTRKEKCEFCGNPTNLDFAEELWGDNFTCETGH